MTNDFTNTTERINALFPQIFNKVEDISNENQVATEALWAGLSDKFVLKMKKILAPLEGVVMDITDELQVKNPDALPVVSVEVVESVGSAIVDATDWNQTEIKNKYVPVQLHRISRPFSLTSYDLQRGERVESKIAAAAEVVAQGVVAQLAAALADIDEEELSDFGPEAAAKLSGIFDDEETNSLILSPAQYAKIVPTSALSLSPETTGVYGINHILKGVGLGDAIALTKTAVAGAIATPAVLANHGGTGMDVRVIGSVAGFPLLLKTKYDWNETLKCSVETMAGFAVCNEDGIKKYSVAD